MTFSEPLSQYEEILKYAIRASMKESGVKLAKTFQTLLIEILTLYMILPGKINFTQMARYGKVVTDAFFSTSTFEKGMSELGFYIVSRFCDNACLHYIPPRRDRILLSRQ